MNQLKPEIGQWYFRRDKGQKFEIVSIDDDDGTIELQDFDGNLDEIDTDAWYAQNIEATSPPEDLTGILDIVQDEADGGDPVEPDGTQPAAQLTRSVEEAVVRLDSAVDENDDVEDVSAESFVAALENEERPPAS